MDIDTFCEELASLDDKDDFQCLVRGYQYGHSQLYMWCSSKTATFRITFHNVVYFNCPKRWKGMHLVKGTDEECWQRLVEFEVLPDEEKYQNRNSQHLFKFKISKTFSEIISSDVFWEKETR